MTADAPHMPFVYVAIPCQGGLVTIHCLRSVLALQAACAERGIGLHIESLGNDGLITRARARLAARFLAHPQATHLLFLDADIAFEPENVFRLLAADKDLVGGVYPLKSIDWAKVRAAAVAGAPDLMARSVGYVIRFIPTPDNSVEVENGVAKVAFVGTGFMMIRRQAVQAVATAHPDLRTDLSDVDPAVGEAVMMFDTLIEPKTGQHLSEDYAFCHRWRELGGEIWADMEARLTHVGPTAFVGSLIEAMRPL